MLDPVTLPSAGATAFRSRHAAQRTRRAAVNRRRHCRTAQTPPSVQRVTALRLTHRGPPGLMRPMSLPVTPRRAAIVAGVVVGIAVATAFVVRDVPDRVVSLFGGPKGGVDRIGGVRIRYVPPANLPADKLDRVLARRSLVERYCD